MLDYMSLLYYTFVLIYMFLLDYISVSVRSHAMLDYKVFAWMPRADYILRKAYPFEVLTHIV